MKKTTYSPIEKPSENTASTSVAQLNLRDQLHAAQILITQYETEIAQLKHDHATRQEETVKQKIEDNEQEIALLQDQLKILQEKNTKNHQRQAQFLEVTQKLKRKNKSLKEKNQILESEATIAAQKEQMLLANLTISAYEHILTSLEKDIAACKVETRAARSAAKPILEEKNNIEKEITDLAGPNPEEGEQLTEQIEALVTTMQTLTQSNTAINMETSALSRELEDFYVAQQNLDRINLGIYQTRVSTVTSIYNMFRAPIDYLQATLTTQVQKAFCSPQMAAIIPQHPVRTLFTYNSAAKPPALPAQNSQSSCIKKCIKPGMNNVIQAD